MGGEFDSAVAALWIALALCLALPLLLLAIPIELTFECYRKEAIEGQVTIRPLFGWIDFKIPLRRVDAAVDPGTAGRDRAPLGDRAQARLLGMFSQAPFRQRVYRLIKDMADCVRLHRLHLHVRLGLGDPADTGILWAVVGPLSAMANNLHNAQVQIEPEFLDAVFEFRAQGCLRLIPLHCIMLIVGLVLSPASMRAWRTVQHPNG